MRESEKIFNIRMSRVFVHLTRNCMSCSTLFWLDFIVFSLKLTKHIFHLGNFVWRQANKIFYIFDSYLAQKHRYRRCRLQYVKYLANNEAYLKFDRLKAQRRSRMQSFTLRLFTLWSNEREILSWFSEYS